MPYYSSFRGSACAMDTTLSHLYWRAVLDEISAIDPANMRPTFLLDKFEYPAFGIVTDLDDSLAPTPAFISYPNSVIVHYCLGGSERILWADADLDFLQWTGIYDELEDIALYQAPDNFSALRMRAGDVAVFFPGEAHLDRCHANGNCLEACRADFTTFVKKLIIRIPITEVPTLETTPTEELTKEPVCI